MRCITFLLLTWLLVTTVVHASPLDMQGSLITPPIDNANCSISSGSGSIDYGQVPRWQLGRATEENSLSFGKRTISISFTCPYSRVFRVSLRGEMTSNGELRYGSRGRTKITLSGAQLDGKNVSIILSRTSNVSGSAYSTPLALTPGLTIIPAEEGRLSKGKVFVIYLELESTLPSVETQVTQRQMFESNLNFDLLD